MQKKKKKKLCQYATDWLILLILDNKFKFFFLNPFLLKGTEQTKSNAL